jgi:hypothetical protein
MTEHGKKLVPVTVNVNAAVPAVALVCESDVITGAGSAPGAVTVKLTELERTGPLFTVIAALPWVAISVGRITAVICVALTNVVTRGEPFQLTTDVFTKFVPLTVSVNPVAVHDDVEDPEVVDAESVEMAGGAIVTVNEVEVPPPGPSVNTRT